MNKYLHPKQFSDEVKDIIKNNPDNYFRIFIGDYFKEREPLLHTQLEKYDDVVEMLTPFFGAEQILKYENYHSEPVDVYFVIYEKKRNRPTLYDFPLEP